MLIVLRASLVEDGEVPERHIGDNQINGVVTKALGFLEARNLNIRVGIKVLEDFSGQLIQFHAYQSRVPGNALRHEPEKEPCPGGRLQNTTAPETELFRHLPHGGNDIAIGVVGVECGFLSGGPFLLG